MTRIRWMLPLFFGVVLTTDASAQFVPVVGLPVIGQNGISFHMGGRQLRIDGFIPTGDPYAAILPVTPTPFGFRQVGPAFLPYPYGYPAYGVINQRITVQVITPASLPPRVGLRAVPDLSGIDLDLEPASKIWGEKPAVAKGAQPKKGELVRNLPKEEKKMEVARAAQIEEKKPAPLVVPPKVEPLPPDGQQLRDQGVAAFRAGDYGIALLRFRQAFEPDAPSPRALFLRGQACIAVGKYREAVEIIQQGLKLQPNWPTSGFDPRSELYDKRADEWIEHRKQLEQTQAKNASADHLFLLGYIAWFDGQRDAAVAHFTQSRALAAEPRWADLFLKAAKGK
jgi:hypothetical protein